MLALLCWTGIQAQETDYAPFAEDGKVWHMKWDLGEPELEFLNYDFDFFIDGDTLIADRQCKKVFSRNRQNKGNVDYECAVFEEGRKVYAIENGEVTPHLLYDFGVAAGDTLAGEDPIFRVQEIKLVNVHGMQRRVFRWSCEIEPVFTRWWVEGVGNNRNPFASFVTAQGDFSCFKSCEVNGLIICDESDFNKLDTLQPSVNCDVNGDGVVDVEDVNAVINAMLRK